MAKRIEDLTFIDDGMFQAVMKQPGICAEVVERLLHLKVKKVEFPELEKQIAPYYTSKGVRLDVYLKDEDKIIDVEIQTYEQDALGKRTRYYQSMIDIDSLMKGEDYPELKDSYILFICTYDPFKDSADKPFGLPCYTFKNTCSQNPAANLDDKCVKVIYNAGAYESEKDKKVQSFLQFICTNEPGKDNFSNRLSRLVEKLKDNEKFRSDYAAMNLHDRDIIRRTRKEAMAVGSQQRAIKDAKGLYSNGVSVEIIAKSLGMTQEQVLKIIKEN